MYNTVPKQKNTKEGGVALLFAILMTSTLLLVAIGISKISYKEILFSIEARDSDRAFTSADTGLECAFYLDSSGVFATASDTFYCSGIPVIVSLGALPDQYEFSLALSPSSCAQVYIDKNYLGTQTRIEAFGYNVRQQQATAPATCVVNATNPRIVSRALRATYDNP